MTVAAAALCATAATHSDQLAERALAGELTHPAIEYPTRPTDDRVTALARRIDAGAIALTFDRDTGFLRSVLEALEVPAESQMLVMSKTGVQGLHTSPDNPRAIYFNDLVTVGYIRGAPLLELTVHDPRQGVLFFTIDQEPRAKLERRSGCLSCHKALGTLHVPGLLLRSLSMSPEGLPRASFGFYDPDDRTPFDKRWGGWYVTGHAGAMAHQGASDVRFEPRGYLSTDSDIVALMVFEHQVRMTNLITRIGWDARLGVPLDADVIEFVDYLLFVDEAPLPNPVTGSTAFARTFSARGPSDSQGRSLRQLDLERRLLKYPCSYMIYSDAFRALPAEAKRAIYSRMADILSGREVAPKYSRLSASDRRAIVGILRETVGELPSAFPDDSPR